MGLYYKGRENVFGTLAIWELSEAESELEALLPKAQTVVAGVKSEKRRKERMAVQLLLQEVFGLDVCVDHYPNGQPFLQRMAGCNRCNAYMHDSISIAHTRRFVVALSHPQKRTGVDIESLDRDFSAVAHKALSDREISYLSTEHSARTLQLAILWCAKEALYKCVSQAGVEFARQMEIDPFTPQESGTLSACFFENDQTNDKNRRGTTFFLNYKVIENHILVYVFAEK